MSSIIASARTSTTNTTRAKVATERKRIGLKSASSREDERREKHPLLVLFVRMRMWFFALTPNKRFKTFVSVAISKLSRESVD